MLLLLSANGSCKRKDVCGRCPHCKGTTPDAFCALPPPSLTCITPPRCPPAAAGGTGCEQAAVDQAGTFSVQDLLEASHLLRVQALHLQQAVRRLFGGRRGRAG